MKRIVYALIIGLLFFISCKTETKPKLLGDKPADNEFSLYIFMNFYEKPLPIKLWVNDSIVYDGLFKYGYKTDFDNHMFINNFKKATDTKFRCQCEFLNQDTIFSYNTSKIDSLSIAFVESYFAVVDNTNRRAWMTD